MTMHNAPNSVRSESESNGLGGALGRIEALSIIYDEAPELYKNQEDLLRSICDVLYSHGNPPTPAW